MAARFTRTSLVDSRRPTWQRCLSPDGSAMSMLFEKFVVSQIDKGTRRSRSSTLVVRIGLDSPSADIKIHVRGFGSGSGPSGGVLAVCAASVSRSVSITPTINGQGELSPGQFLLELIIPKSDAMACAAVGEFQLAIHAQLFAGPGGDAQWSLDSVDLGFEGGSVGYRDE